METYQIIHMLELKEHELNQEQFRVYRCNWLVELDNRVLNGDVTVDTIALIEDIKDSFLGE